MNQAHLAIRQHAVVARQVAAARAHHWPRAPHPRTFPTWPWPDAPILALSITPRLARLLGVAPATSDAVYERRGRHTVDERPADAPSLLACLPLDRCLLLAVGAKEPRGNLRELVFRVPSGRRVLVGLKFLPGTAAATEIWVGTVHFVSWQKILQYRRTGRHRPVFGTDRLPERSRPAL